MVQEQADTMIAARQPPFIIILSVSLIHVSLKTTTILPLDGIKHKTTPNRERPVLGFPTFNSSPEQLFVPYHSQDLQMVAVACFVESVMLTPIMAAEGKAMEMRNNIMPQKMMILIMSILMVVAMIMMVRIGDISGT